ncbi:MAG: acyl-CoA thioesterase [Trueperaceae bacterium]|nr:MAG: acyl-CoA thioesterase [Trueperaceae bacterium]
MPIDPNTTRVSSWVITTDVVFPDHTNPLGTLFGGRVLELMDVNAGIACQRFCRQVVVTASTEPIDFRNPIHVGEIIEVKSRVAWTGRTSMIVRCEVHGENPLSGERRLCTIGHMNFVALDQRGRPTPVPRLRIESDLERRHWEIGQQVRDDTLRRRERKGYQES